MSDFTGLIGREDINDLEAILSITNDETDAVLHAVSSNPEAIFSWDYERSRPALVKLYEKAKTSQWNAETDLPWETDVDQEKVVLANATAAAGADGMFGAGLDLTDTPFAKWGDKEWIEFGIQSQNLRASG